MTCVCVSVAYVNAYTGVVMLRFRKVHYQLLWSALPFITSIWSQGKKVQCFFNCIHVGGERISVWSRREHAYRTFQTFQTLFILIYFRGSQSYTVYR